MLNGVDLGETIRRARKKKGLTMIELSEMTDLTQGYLSKIENNIKIPKIETLKKIGNILDIPLGELLIGAGYKAEWLEMFKQSIETPNPILTLGEAIDHARSDWTNENEPFELYDAPLELISEEANIPLEKLLSIQNGENVALSVEEVTNLAKALDVSFAALYLIINRESNSFEKSYVDGLVNRIFHISPSEADRMKDKTFEEFCNDYNEQQLKYNSLYVPNANELIHLYQEYQFVRFIDPLIRSFALSQE